MFSSFSATTICLRLPYNTLISPPFKRPGSQLCLADMKAKASKVANSGVEKVQNVRDRNTSVPLKKTNWDPYGGAPPPPPRPGVNPNTKPQALTHLPPPPSRTGSSISSGSTSPPTLNRLPSIASSVAPPLPSRVNSIGGPPPLPRRSNTLEPPPLPERRASPSPTISHSLLPLPPSRSPLPPSRPLTTPPPPVVNLFTKPEAPAEKDEIDWANLTDEDKQVFFSWLDDFFGHFFGVPVGPGQSIGSTRSSAAHSSALP
ncbi:hypothetical protein AN958_01024 [Leucoagaricus sp. SymC.cos]|nr:hypothetical protein AN958_01024 [Leucoagaricus sp. SymC.cos]